MKVKIATAYSIAFLTASRGHEYCTTYAALYNGLELGLWYFKTVGVNAKANQLIIGSSISTEDIILPLYQAGKEFHESRNAFLIYFIAITSCSCVGVVGATLCAGGWRLQGIHRLIIDSLLSVRPGDSQRQNHHRFCHRTLWSLLGSTWGGCQLWNNFFRDIWNHRISATEALSRIRTWSSLPAPTFLISMPWRVFRINFRQSLRYIPPSFRMTLRRI